MRPAPSPPHTLPAPQGRLVLSNKMARTIGFFYTLFLHCLVFLVSVQVGDQGFIHLSAPTPGTAGTLSLKPGTPANHKPHSLFLATSLPVRAPGNSGGKSLPIGPCDWGIRPAALWERPG